jgi:prevent-host-death family protein
MGPAETVNATQFKAKCLEILDRVGDHEVEQVSITKHGRVVAVLVPPPVTSGAPESIHGFLRGSVTIPTDFDLTAPVMDEPLLAEAGGLHG